jgi:hypothetical protein
MAVWRRRALELFPELRHEIQGADSTPYSLFFELLPMARTAHETENIDLLRRIYTFAEWCMAQKAKDLWNSAGVCFYEHVFDWGKGQWPNVVPWLSPYVIHCCWTLWEARLEPPELERLRLVIERRTKHLYR